ncbi:MAG TPA: PadR family transcriptional regulator [Candidatus Bathyarchaeia archaeon]|nr:PadR family transcriptional regulator [Candidatus Bathyarchaeia archaeon]
MKRPADSLLGYAILGLLHGKPKSGYELRKIFSETAMGNYSDSPGAIYPALRRLERDRQIAGRNEKTAGGRERRIFRLTNAGTSKLKQWTILPVTADDLDNGAAELMLRFAFLEQVHGPRLCTRFLSMFHDALEDYIDKLEKYAAVNRSKMPRSAQLALEQGIRGYRSMYDWTEYAEQQYRTSGKRTSAKGSQPSKGGRR